MLKEIPISELVVGMYVHSIATQSGNLKIKTRGLVSSWDIVDDLKKKGIQTLIVDESKRKQRKKSDEPDVIEEDRDTPVSYENEIGRAKFIHEQGKILQKRLVTAIQQGQPLDFELADEFTSKIVSSTKRNTDALMTLTRIREKGGYLLEHATNVSVLMAIFARQLDMPVDEIQCLSMAGLLHDIGMVTIGENITGKSGNLNTGEWQVIREHVAVGLNEMSDDPDFSDITKRAVAEHHERLDGSGYPDGLAGDDISRYGRMLAIVDAFDAMTADRPYRKALPVNKALADLLHSRDKFDFELVQHFIKCIGVYPTGSLVLLDNGKVAMVTQQNDKQPLLPHIKVFYSTRGNHFLPAKDVDLSVNRANWVIERSIGPEELGIDFIKYFNQSVAG